MPDVVTNDVFLFSTVELIRTEAHRLRVSFGAEASARSLETAATWVEQDIRAFFGLGFDRGAAAHKTGYSERQVERLIKEKVIKLLPSGEIPLLSLPVKAGALSKLLSTPIKHNGERRRDY